MIGNRAVAVSVGEYPSPVTEESAVSHPSAKTTDISSVTMTLPMVLAIVGTALTVNLVGYIWNAPDRRAMVEMQSDIRDMRTRMEGQAEVRKLEKDLLDAQLASMKAAIESQANRGAALNMAQELSKLQNERRR